MSYTFFAEHREERKFDGTSNVWLTCKSRSLRVVVRGHFVPQCFTPNWPMILFLTPSGSRASTSSTASGSGTASTPCRAFRFRRFLSLPVCLIFITAFLFFPFLSSILHGFILRRRGGLACPPTVPSLLLQLRDSAPSPGSPPSTTDWSR